MKQVSFNALIYKIQTSMDGGWKVTLDVPDSETAQMNQLAMLRECNLQIGVVSIDSETDFKLEDLSLD